MKDYFLWKLENIMYIKISPKYMDSENTEKKTQTLEMYKTRYTKEVSTSLRHFQLKLSWTRRWKDGVVFLRVSSSYSGMELAGTKNLVF